MKRLLVALLLMSVPLAGQADPDITKPQVAAAPAKPAEPTTPKVDPLLGVKHSLSVEKTPRTYHLYVPKREARKPRPLVVVLHGAGGTARAIAEVTGFTQMAEREDFVVAYPEGTGRSQSWNAGKCCGYASRTDVPDSEFIKQLVIDVRKKVDIDKTRIYATGFDNGGMMSYRLACDAGDVFAAVGVVAGAMNTESCNPMGRPSLVIIHARNDEQVPFDGGAAKGGWRAALGNKPVQDASVKDAMDFWIKANYCRAFPLEDSKPDKNTVNYFCAEKRDLRLYTLPDGGHSWPGGFVKAPEKKEGELDDVDPATLPSTVPATELLWEFFSKHPPQEIF